MTLSPAGRSPAIVAHRGSWREHRENTMAAFQAAFEEGADMVELDVWLSADGVPMVHHDQALGPDRRSITASTEARLREDPETSHIPSLEEVLTWAEGKIAVYVELKGAATPEPVARLIRERGVEDQVVVGSFEPELVARVRSVAPGLSTSILFHSTDLGGAIRLGLDLGVAYLHPCWKRVGDSPADLLDRDAMDRVRSEGLGVVTWDEDWPDQLVTLLTEARPDAISTNLPGTMARLRASTDLGSAHCPM